MPSNSSTSSSSLLWLATSATAAALAAGAYWYRSRMNETRAISQNKKKKNINNNNNINNSNNIQSEDEMIMERFEQCVTHLKSKESKIKMNQLSQSIQLELYGLYKQSTMGDCIENIDTPPSSMNMVAYAKYHAWDKYRGVSRTNAMQFYIDKVLHLEFTAEMYGGDDDDDDDFNNDNDGDWEKDSNEDEDENTPVMDMAGLGMTQSTLMNEQSAMEIQQETEQQAQEYPIHHAAQEDLVGKLTQLLQHSEAATKLKQVDSSGNATTAAAAAAAAASIYDSMGQTPMHLAADKGHLQCLQVLLTLEESPFFHQWNAVDEQDGMSILQTAVMASQYDICEWLLEEQQYQQQQQQSNINDDINDSVNNVMHLADNDGETAWTCIQDSKKEEPKLYALFEKYNKNITTATTDKEPKVKEEEEEEVIEKTESKEEMMKQLDGAIELDLDDDGDI